MAAYKDEKRGTWYVSFHYYDWTGKNCRKVKRGFKTKREATEWERHFRMKEAADMDMTFGEFVEAYTRDMKPKLKHNTWLTKEHILRTKLLPYFKDKKMCDIRATDIIQGKIGRLKIITKRSAPENRKSHSMRSSCRLGIRMIWGQKQQKGKWRQRYWMNI